MTWEPTNHRLGCANRGVVGSEFSEMIGWLHFAQITRPRGAVLNVDLYWQIRYSMETLLLLLVGKEGQEFDPHLLSCGWRY